MAMVSLTTPGISPVIKSDANRRLSSVKTCDRSLQTVYGFINSPRQHHVQKSVFPLAVKSMKMLDPRLKLGYSQNCSIFQTYDKIVKASHIKNGDTSSEPETGVSVFILKDNKILFGRRRSVSVASNIYLLPGGHLESGESYEECAIREVKEETGLDITNIELITPVNNLYYDATHLELTYARAHLVDPNQTPQNMEPDKCDGWEWFDLNNLPEPMFGPLRELLQGGFNPFPIAS